MIQIKFPDDEAKMIEASGDSNAPLLPNDNPWDECPSDEENNGNCEYKYEEDEATMSIKKYKRVKVTAENVAQVSLNAPIVYVEEVVPFQNFPNGTTVIDELMESEYVLPFGYPTEQFFGMLKNDIYKKQAEFAERNQKQTFTSAFTLEDEDETQEKNTQI